VDGAVCMYFLWFSVIHCEQSWVQIPIDYKVNGSEGPQMKCTRKETLFDDKIEEVNKITF
jgi:hypothetical protein